MGVGDGINEGEEVGRGVVGNSVGARLGIPEGITLGDGDGIDEGRWLGIEVVGRRVGCFVGI